MGVRRSSWILSNADIVRPTLNLIDNNFEYRMGAKDDLSPSLVAAEVDGGEVELSGERA